MTLERSAEMPETPTLLEMATTEEQREIIRLLARTEAVGFMLVAPPDIPRERVDELRSAFSRMTRDAQYLAEAKSLNFGNNPMEGAQLQWLAESIVSTPPEIVQKFIAAASPAK